MAITRQTLMQSASSEQYRMGQDIFLVDRRIHQFQIDHHPFTDEPMVSAIVLDADGTENEVNITVNEMSGNLNNFFCSCNHYDPSHPLCKHQVATLLKYISRRTIDEQSSFSNKNLQFANRLLENYATLGLIPQNTDESFGSIVIEPVFHQKDGISYLEFKIGTKKKYIIKDLLAFARRMHTGEFFEYGKSLKFHHTMAAFHQDSIPFVKLLINYVDDYLYHYKCQQDISRSFFTLKPLRYLPLTPNALDDFFELSLHQPLRVYIGEKVQLCQFTTSDPVLSLNITPEEPLGFLCQLSPYTFYEGRHHSWLQADAFIFKCSDDFNKNMKPLLLQMNQKSDKNFFLLKQQMPSFCGNILKRIAPYVEIDSSSICLENYMPPEASFKIYLDMPYPDLITCHASVQYEDVSLSLKETHSEYHHYRDLLSEQKVLSGILRYFSLADPALTQDDFMIADDDQAIFLFLEQGLSYFYQLGEVFVADELQKLKILQPPKTTFGVSIQGNLLELNIESDNMPYDELAAIIQSYRKRRRFHRLKSGQFIRLTDNAFHTISELADGLHLSEKDISDGKIILPIYRAGYIDAVLEQHHHETKTHRDRYFKSLIRDMKLIRDSDFDVPAKLQSVLRDYQKTGYRWLQTISKLGFGGILADDMGLGKTIQIIALLLANQTDSNTHHLIVCPSSLVYNWQNEIQHFAPELTTLIINGTASERQALLKDISGFNILITSYDMLKRDILYYNNLTFQFHIIDEAQYIKNHRTQAAHAVCEIHAKTRFALTGTPIENRLSELWSIFQFLMPGFLYSYNVFKTELEQPIIELQDETASTRLRQMIRPFILRRLKSDVLKELPEKMEHAVLTAMTDEQKKIYDAHTAMLKQDLMQQTHQTFQSKKIQILSQLTRLRQICCDPSLIYENYHGGSAKIDTCMQLIHDAIDGGHKILLFSQFTSMLDLIETRMKNEHISYYRLDGSTKSETRTRLVQNFNLDDTSVFIISLKSGGTGLNLTGASIVIHFDPWWNIAAQNQATDRAYRIGQTKNLTVYKLIAKNTIEEKILKLQQAKQALSDQIINEENILSQEMTKDFFFQLLDTAHIE